MIQNRKIEFEHNILATFEAGMELKGTEVKSLRLGMGTIVGAYVVIKNQEAFLINMQIPQYRFSRYTHEEKRKRRLLLHKKEIKKLVKGSDKGVSILVTEVYFNDRGYAKAKIALCTRKKLFDKRKTIKERELSREKAKTIKSFS